jgi:hypothetical protein
MRLLTAAWDEVQITRISTLSSSRRPIAATLAHRQIPLSWRSGGR